MENYERSFCFVEDIFLPWLCQIALLVQPISRIQAWFKPLSTNQALKAGVLK